jgi:hypothetical protein
VGQGGPVDSKEALFLLTWTVQASLTRHILGHFFIEIFKRFSSATEGNDLQMLIQEASW